MANFPLSKVEGGGGSVEVGQLISTVASTHSGSALLPCDGNSFNAITYPDLASVIMATPLLNTITTLVDSPLSVSSSSSYDNNSTGHAVSEDLSTILFSSLSSTGTLGMSLYEDLLTTPVEVFASVGYVGAVSDNSYRSCINADGSKGFTLFNDGNGKLAYINGATISNKTLVGNSGTIEPERMGCDINLSGDLGIACWYDSGLSRRTHIYYTLNGGDTTFSAVNTGMLGASQAIGCGIVEGTNGVYIIDNVNQGGVNVSRIYYTPDVTTVTSWTTSGTYSTVVKSNASSGGGKLHVSTINNLLYTSYSNPNYSATVDQVLISSDAAATMEEVTLTTDFTDYLGNAATATVRNVTQRKSDSALLYHVYITTSINGVASGYQVYIETFDRDANWLNNGFLTVLPNINGPTPENSNSPIDISNYSLVNSWDSTTGVGIGISRYASTNTNIVIDKVDFNGRYYTPIVESNKIVAEE